MLLVAAAVGVFVVTWFLRFNDPNGSFAGLTDDHFFYVVRGWQILYGDLPVRDFVDHGAPLHFYVAAAVQLLFGRGTLSELAFTTTMLALGAALTCWLAARASGSVAAGLLGAAVHVSLFPRFYNYPKVLAYAAAIPLLWWMADSPGRRPLFWLAVTTALAFLFRHDHGVYVAVIVALLLVLLRGLPWRERVRHAALYAALTVAALSPYLLFVQLHGGVTSYIAQTASWAARERERTPMEWPGVFENLTAWWYYSELILPVLALWVVSVSRDACRPGWPHARVKIAIVALLGTILNAGFLRTPLEGRLADPSVPHAILVAWLAAALPSLFGSPASWGPLMVRWRRQVAAALAVAAAPIAFVVAVTLTHDLYERADNAGLTEGPRRTWQSTATVVRTVRADWQLENWASRPERSELITLAMFLSACTEPDARIFVQPYIPQVLALARRPFAGGHADLRSGFFTTERDQRLILARLQRQRVPVALLSTPDALEDFGESFPLLAAYLDEHYTAAGTHVFDGRYPITLLVNTGERAERRFESLGWPCLVPGLSKPRASASGR